MVGAVEGWRQVRPPQLDPVHIGRVWRPYYTLNAFRCMVYYASGGHSDIREDIMLAVAIISAAPAIMASFLIGPSLLLDWPVVLVTVSACGFLALAILMHKRVVRLRENRDRWVRICCMYRQGHRDRIARGEFRVAANYMAAMDQMDADTRRDANSYMAWKEGSKKGGRDGPYPEDAMPDSPERRLLTRRD